MPLLTNKHRLAEVQTPHGVVKFEGPHFVADATDEQAAFLEQIPGYQLVPLAAAAEPQGEPQGEADQAPAKKPAAKKKA